MTLHHRSSVLHSLLGSQQWFVVKNLNVASGMYYVKLRAANGRGAGAASAVVAVSTVLTGFAAVNIACTRCS